MKKTDCFVDGRHRMPGFLKVFCILTAAFLFACEKDNMLQDADFTVRDSMAELTISDNSSVLYYGPVTFLLPSEKSLDETASLENPDFNLYEGFTLKVQNGAGGRTKITRMEILIDGELVISGKDFKRNLRVVSRDVTLTAESVLEVRLEGTAGRYITVLIEAKSLSTNITDIEGNVYRTVKIGDQWWMADNLKTTRFNDGTSILVVPGITDWFSNARDHISALCWYDNNAANKDTYGALYNWSAAGDERLCPAGWHVPDSYEFYYLCLYLDPDAAIGYFSGIAGGMLKEAGLSHWESPNTGATNETGFTALPGGARDAQGLFVDSGRKGVWWLDNGLSSISLRYDDTYASFSEGGNDNGYSVRCIKN